MGIRGAGEYAGTLVNLLDPRLSDFQPAPIARTLANEHRYAGNYGPYSVAQHAVLVAGVVNAELCGGAKDVLSALHHDDAEAITGDLPRPVKNACPDFRKLEARLNGVINERYGIDVSAHKVKEADAIVFASEVRRLVPPDAQWMYEAELEDIPQSLLLRWELLVPWTADVAFARYMDLHEQLVRL